MSYRPGVKAMLEAVGSSIQAASLTRQSVEQVNVTDSYAANPDRVQKAASPSSFNSMRVHVDVNFDKAVLQIYNPETGDVTEQIPSESSLEAHRREVARQASRDTEVLYSSSRQTTSDTEEAGQKPTGAPVSTADNGTVKVQQQIAAFEAAAQSGASNAGVVNLFA